jgi:dUTP pyrophosphatase
MEQTPEQSAKLLSDLCILAPPVRDSKDVAISTIKYCNASDTVEMGPTCEANRDLMPKRGGPLEWNDAGWDLTAATNVTIESGDTVCVPLGVRVVMPNTVYGQLQMRSSWAKDCGLIINAGVIDSGFTGEVEAVLYNSSVHDVSISRGDRVVQLLIQPRFIPNALFRFPALTIKMMDNMCEINDKMLAESRGNSDFGSTSK